MTRESADGWSDERAAVDDERVPGDPGARVARQEERGVGDVLGEAEALERRVRGRGLFGGLPERAANSVFTSPGAKAFTRTPGASSTASVFVRWMSAAFVTL